MEVRRTPTKKKAKQLAKYFSKERPDYPYLKRLFKDLIENSEKILAREV